MKTTASIAWPGGKAKEGESVDPLQIPTLTRARWLTDGVLVAETAEEAAEWPIPEPEANLEPEPGE